MSKVIATILSLKDQMSSPIVKVSKNVNNMSKEVQRASKQVASFANNTKKKFEDIGDKAVKVGLGVTTAIGGLGLKEGFSNAFNMEGYKAQLETATKDTKKAGELMQWANKFANITPFENDEVVEATAKLESMGLSAENVLPQIADMAGATNKSMNQAAEAFIDAQTGELERLKEFGIKKSDIAKKANEMFKNQEVINQKGQIVDQKKFNDALMALMEDRFKGGAEKLGNTTKGIWSTIKGTISSSLASMVGMQQDGTIKQGSMLDVLKNKAKEVADTFNRWGDDGTLDRIANKATEVFTKIYNAVNDVIRFLVDNKETIANVALAFASFYVAIKVINALSTAIGFLKIVWLILSGVITLTPIGWIIIAIGAVIGIVIVLYAKFQWFRDFIAGLGQFLMGLIQAIWFIIKGIAIFIGAVIMSIGTIIGWLISNVIAPLVEFIVGHVFNSISNVIQLIIGIVQNIIGVLASIIGGIITIIGGIIDFIVGVFTGNWGKAWEGVKEIFSGIWEALGGVVKGILNTMIDGINFVIRGFNKLASFKVPDWVPLVGGKSFEVNIPEIPKFAKGGIATQPSIFGEAGAEMAIPLRNTPRSQALLKQADGIINGNNSNNGGVNVYLTIQGNVLGNEEFANDIGNTIWNQIKMAQMNTAGAR